MSFATVTTGRHRTKVTKGPGSKAAGIAMAGKLIEAAQERWRAVNAAHLVALVRAGARFEAGKLVDRDPVLEATQAADDTVTSSVSVCEHSLAGTPARGSSPQPRPGFGSGVSDPRHPRVVF